MLANLSIQLLNSLKPRIATLNKTVAVPVAEDIRVRAIANSNTGRAFGDDDYERTYAPRSIKEREKGNFQVQFVDLRRKQKRIERMRVRKPINADTGAVIGWDDASHGQIFKGHHEGANKLPVRRIFPATPGSVPDEVHQLANKLTLEVLRGK